jgi:hypothetical protein
MLYLGCLILAMTLMNALQWSPLFTQIAMGDSPPVEFEANGRTYNMGYYLCRQHLSKVDTFVKLVQYLKGKKELDFHNAQVVSRKDMGRAFGTLQSQFAIVRGLARFWDHDIL